ncbi:MAG: tetratricopeptide repeat protein [Gemmatimonadetes bacterium]|nr:tetratricopeptide repeat protein [Gemmatimonadota bacterium]
MSRQRTAHPRAARPTAAPQARTLLDAATRRHMRGALNDAADGYRQVLALDPLCAPALNNLGAILADRGELAEAERCFRQSVAHDPSDAEAHHNLGLALGALRRPDEGIAALTAAVARDAGRSAWWIDLGNLLLGEQRCDEALAAYDRAVELDPASAPAIANRGIALRGLRRLDEAADAMRAALVVDASYVDALSNLGIIEKERRRFDDARAAIDAALALAPTHAAARVNLAVLLMEMNQLDAAHEIAAQLVAEHPGHAEALNVLGNCAFERADWAEAERLHREVLALEPDNRNALWNLAVLTLLRGDFANGFRAFEARKRLISVLFTRRRFAVEEWNGAPLAGRSILIIAEQGIGDVIQCARYATVLKARGAGRVLLECPASLVPLLRDMTGVDATVSPGEPLPPFDTFAYVMSLPMLCGTTPDSVPHAAGYLRAPARPVGERVASLPGRLRVGLVWAGNPSHQRDLLRSVPLATLDPLLALEDVTFVSLQKGPAAAQLASAPGAAGVIDLDPALHDFSDSAAAIAALDLVITVDTSIAHLAGALGAPVWMLCPHVPDWRWMVDRTDSPWYESMRIYRQPRHGAWADVIAAVCADLAPRRDMAPTGRAPAGRALTSDRRPLEIAWPIGVQSGWGTYGMHLAIALRRSAHVEPVLASPPVLDGLSPLQRAAVGDLRVAPRAAGNVRARLVALGNHALGDPTAEAPRGAPHVGTIFFEDTAWDAAALARVNAYDSIIAGSTWNAEYLKALGVRQVSLLLQGVDPALFHPGPPSGTLGDRFLVFSGGKLEYRKGQDIVVEAFRRFRARHDDAVLVTAWHNHWPATMAGLDAMGYVHGLPDVVAGQLQVVPWLARHGIPPESVLDLGLQTHAVIASVLRDVDVAVFPNRCEGGTNLVAMEAMACGAPVVLAANTGHLNLIGVDTCYALGQQAPIVRAPALYGGTLCWGESDPDELVERMEAAYDDRVGARRRGAAGAALMHELPWPRQADRLVTQLGLTVAP